MKINFPLVLTCQDFKLVRLITNVIVLSLSDGEAFDWGGAFDLGDFWPHMAFQLGRLTGVANDRGRLTGGV